MNIMPNEESMGACFSPAHKPKKSDLESAEDNNDNIDEDLIDIDEKL
jgi:hypothetical protein